jgi:hypothetical protein
MSIACATDAAPLRAHVLKRAGNRDRKTRLSRIIRLWKSVSAIAVVKFLFDYVL